MTNINSDWMSNALSCILGVTRLITVKALIKVPLKKIITIHKDTLFGVKKITSDPWGCLV